MALAALALARRVAAVVDGRASIVTQCLPAKHTLMSSALALRVLTLTPTMARLVLALERLALGSYRQAFCIARAVAAATMQTVRQQVVLAVAVLRVR